MITVGSGLGKREHYLWLVFQAKYNKRLCVNVIAEIGFGPGALKKKGAHDAVYILNPNEKGIFFFSQDHIQTQLTFDWFKRNIICDEQEWVCLKYPPEDAAGTSRHASEENSTISL